MMLTESELRNLTGRRQKTCQVQVLRFMGIEHKIRPDGSVAVLAAHVEQLFGVKEPGQRKVKNAEPNWSAI